MSPLQCAAFEKLRHRARSADGIDIRRELDRPGRIEATTHLLGDVYWDFSKNRIGPQELSLLNELARQMDIEGARDAMVAGEPINETEGRRVGHMALRSGREPEVRGVLEAMEAFCRSVICGDYGGCTGRAVTDVVNIGIGGSDLGPRMVVEALAYERNRLGVHFVSNVDGHHIDRVLDRLDPETTLFVVVSKTFTTLETMLNAKRAKEWLSDKTAASGCGRHFVAVTANARAAVEFGIDEEGIFGFWDWVGGRFSLWSSVGLSVALAVGFEKFVRLLDGASRMDEHFRTAPVERNVPVQAALLDFWYSALLGYATLGIFPYDQRLHCFPAYLQQLFMESNGKQTDRDGRKVAYPTCPVVWGEVGTNGQHAFFQLLHQGTWTVPCDFIAVAKAHHGDGRMHSWLLANCLAQTRALLMGRSAQEVIAEGTDEALVPFKTFGGGRPSTSLILKELNPSTLGMLAAFYEHRVFCLGHFQNVYSFDQWGVELGKALAKDIHERKATFDPSTEGQLAVLSGWRG